MKYDLTYTEWRAACANWMARGMDGVRGGPMAYVEQVRREYGPDDAYCRPEWAESYADELTHES